MNNDQWRFCGKPMSATVTKIYICTLIISLSAVFLLVGIMLYWGFSNGEWLSHRFILVEKWFFTLDLFVFFLVKCSTSS